jgi:tryptophan synthase alpha chain
VTSRLSSAFERARAEGRVALVVYLTAGHPDLDTTPRLLVAAAEAGADIVEVGVPFSDPTADGPAIQRASERALRRGTTLRGVLEVIRAARSRTDVGVLLFSYYNPILAFGEEALARAAVAAGVDGLLVVDLPPEVAGPLHAPARAAGLDFVPLLAPTSDASRVAAVARVASGFVYYVSLTGVTGATAPALDEAARRARTLSAQLGLPVAVGFGVKTPDDVARVAAHADGVVVGSALVAAVDGAASPDAAVGAVASLVSALRAATWHPDRH